MSSVKLAVYPGTFDPITLGHLNVIERASKLFDKLVVAVGVNPGKAPWFTTEERCEMIRQSSAERGLDNVEVATYTGLTVQFAKQIGARVIVRGVRPLTDIPAELTMMMANTLPAATAHNGTAGVTHSPSSSPVTAADRSVTSAFL